MRYPSVTFTGKSGEKYHFHAWSLDSRFKPLAAVYFVTKRARDNTTYSRASHDGIYIGQTANLADPFGTEAQFECFRKHGANCICIHLLEIEERRIAVEQDLITQHRTHCNQRERINRIFETAV
jgi:hypothetical protein